MTLASAMSTTSSKPHTVTKMFLLTRFLSTVSHPAYCKTFVNIYTIYTYI